MESNQQSQARAGRQATHSDKKQQRGLSGHEGGSGQARQGGNSGQDNRLRSGHARGSSDGGNYGLESPAVGNYYH